MNQVHIFVNISFRAELSCRPTATQTPGACATIAICASIPQAIEKDNTGEVGGIEFYYCYCSPRRGLFMVVYWSCFDRRREGSAEITKGIATVDQE